MDNCLQSLSSTDEAKQLIDKMKELLSAGGFEIRQWASNYPEVIAHLPTEAQSDSTLYSLHSGSLGTARLTRLAIEIALLSTEEPTMQNIYRVLASQYDPLGYILPYTTRAKILVQALWINKRGWDDSIGEEMLDKWQKWTNELQYLPMVTMPRCYFPICPEPDKDKIELHVFCDASERAYGSVAYLCLQDEEGRIHTSFVMARSCVAPKSNYQCPDWNYVVPLLEPNWLSSSRLNLLYSSITPFSGQTPPQFSHGSNRNLVITRCSLAHGLLKYRS